MSQDASPEFTTLEIAVDGDRGTLTLARSERLNALTLDSLDELVAAARWFDAQPDLEVVVVRGAGSAFCAGADVAVFSGGLGDDPRAAADAGRRMADAVQAMLAVTIASIHGYCIGGGVVLAACCDLRVAAEDAVFGIPEIDLGLPLAWGGIPRLVREIGPALTKELVMTGRRFDAAEALRAGLLNRVVLPGELDTAVDDLAATLAAKAGPPLRATKRHVNAVADAMVGTAHSWADADGLLAAMADPESRAAAAAYLARLASD